MRAVEGIAFWIIARLWLKYNFEPQSAQNRRPEYLLVHQCLSRRCRPLWTAAEKQCTPPAYFRTTADFCGIRRNSSKTKVSFFRTFSFTAEKKKGGDMPLISPLSVPFDTVCSCDQCCLNTNFQVCSRFSLLYKPNTIPQSVPQSGTFQNKRRLPFTIAAFVGQAVLLTVVLSLFANNRCADSNAAANKQ